MKRKQVSLKDAVVSGAVVQEAIINILEEKGIATREEIMEEVKKVKKQMEKEKHGFDVSEN